MNSASAFFFVLWFDFYTAPVGLDWKELKDLLNPEFNWTDAVQRALGTDDLLNEVCCLLLSICI